MPIHEGPDVAAEVRAAIARRRLSQAEFASALGMSQSAVSRRLSGEIPFSVPEVALAARILGVEISELILDAGNAVTPALAEEPA